MDSSWSANGALPSSAPPAWWGSRSVSPLADHPWFEIAVVAELPRAAPGKRMKKPLPTAGRLIGRFRQNDRPARRARRLRCWRPSPATSTFVFCAVDMKKDEIRALEDAYARSETPVVSRQLRSPRYAGCADDRAAAEPAARRCHRTSAQAAGVQRSGLVTVRTPDSLQSRSYVPATDGAVRICKPHRAWSFPPIRRFPAPAKTFGAPWPEMVDNVIPHIGGGL